MQPDDAHNTAHADTKYWVAFTRIPTIGPARTRTLEGAFGTMEAAWHATIDDLRSTGLDPRVVAQVRERRPRIDPDEEMAALERQGIGALPWSSPDYPDLLKTIADPPPVLFHRGEFRPEDRRAVAVVGTRKATAYGREACASLVRDLASSGGDHRQRHGPRHRRDRASDDTGGWRADRGRDGVGAGHGVPAGAPGAGAPGGGVGRGGERAPAGAAAVATGRSPRRNRILSGLTLGVLVVEAPHASGAMWTVHWALEQGREVFAVPGSIFSPASRGANRLVQDGAKLVLSPEDVLEELNLSTLVAPAPMPTKRVEAEAKLVPAPAKAAPAAGPEGDLLSLLADEPRHVDEVCRQAGMPITTVSSALTLLELKGLVRQVGAMHYVRTREPRSLYRTVA